MADVLDGPQSKAGRLAYHKMASAMAVLNYCAAEGRQCRAPPHRRAPVAEARTSAVGTAAAGRSSRRHGLQR